MEQRTKKCKHGNFTYYADDEFVGRSLDLYGEYSEQEVTALAKILRPGDVVVEVGANIGALTIPMSKMVEPDGRVYAIEPQPENLALLAANTAFLNAASCVLLVDAAASDVEGSAHMSYLRELGHKNYGNVELKPSGTIPVRTIRIDDLGLKKLKLLKIDAQKHELQVLNGARETIERCRPLIYCENDDPEHCQQLVSALVDMGYRCFWHRPPLWNKDNYLENERNVFGGVVSINMICTHETSGIEITNLEEVADLRIGSDMYNREIMRYGKIVAANPNDLQARAVQAHYYNMMQMQAHSVDLLQENLKRDPNHISSKFVLGAISLQHGDWEEGWTSYELRSLQPNSHTFGHRKHDVPKWDGIDTKETVLLWCEQGFGDTIMFGRFLKEALTRAPNLILEVQPQLYELFELCRVVPEGQLFRLGRTMPSYTAHCALPSLPFVLKRFTDRQLKSHPYLYADGKMVASWLARSTPRIGICCVGSPRSERSYTRDIDPFLTDKLAKEFGPFLQLAQEGQFESFADTAAAIAALDLVITVDTSIAHLAGSMGVPTWLMLSYDPDWRWGLKSTNTIWYENMRVFRQPELCDWESVIDEVALEFEKRRPSKAA